MFKENSSLSSESNQTMNESIVNSFIAVNSLTSLLNISVNSILIYMIFKPRLLKNTSYQFIICLSLSELCIGTIVQPMLSVRLFIRNPAVLPFLKLGVLLSGIMFAQISPTITGVISLDRYLYMKNLTYYNSRLR